MNMLQNHSRHENRISGQSSFGNLHAQWDAKTSLHISSVNKYSNRVHDLNQCKDFFLSKVRTVVPFDFWLAGVASNANNGVKQIVNINPFSLSLCDYSASNSWAYLFRLLVEQRGMTDPLKTANLKFKNRHSDSDNWVVAVEQNFVRNVFQIVAIEPRTQITSYHCISLASAELSGHYSRVLREIVPYVQMALHQCLSKTPAQAKRETRLTAREKEVLQLMALGDSNPDIAQHLGVSAFTVKNQVHSILQKLGVSNRMQAITKGMALGILQP